jgi:hypothetical protein
MTGEVQVDGRYLLPNLREDEQNKSVNGTNRQALRLLRYLAEISTTHDR